MIELYKMIQSLYNPACSIDLTFLAIHFTRGNRFKLDKKHVHYDLGLYISPSYDSRKYFLLMELSRYGIVYLMMWLLLTQLIVLRTGLISFGISWI